MGEGTIELRFACEFCWASWPETGDQCCAPVDHCPERFCAEHCAAFHPWHGPVISIVVSFSGVLEMPRVVSEIRGLQ